MSLRFTTVSITFPESIPPQETKHVVVGIEVGHAGTVIGVQSGIVPTHIVSVRNQVSHSPAGGISGDGPIEAMITERIERGIPTAMMMNLSAHEKHRRAENRDAKRPSHSSLRERVPILAAGDGSSDQFYKIAILAKVRGPRLVPHSDLVDGVKFPLIEYLIVGAQQVTDGAPGRWKTGTSDQRLNLRKVVVCDGASKRKRLFISHKARKPIC